MEWSILCIHRECSFQCVFRDMVIPGLVFWWVPWRFALGNLLSLQPSQAHLQPLTETGLFKATNSSCLKNLEVPGVHEPKLASPLTSFLYDENHAYLSEFIYHSGLIRPQRKFYGNINNPSWKPSYLCWFSKTSISWQEMQFNYNKKCSVEKRVGGMGDDGVVKMPQRRFVT